MSIYVPKTNEYSEAFAVRQLTDKLNVGAKPLKSTSANNEHDVCYTTNIHPVNKVC